MTDPILAAASNFRRYLEAIAAVESRARLPARLRIEPSWTRRASSSPFRARGSAGANYAAFGGGAVRG